MQTSTMFGSKKGRKSEGRGRNGRDLTRHLVKRRGGEIDLFFISSQGEGGNFKN